MIHSQMSIPEFINELDLYQLRMVEEISKEKIKEITNQDKVEVWVFSSGSINEGFYENKEYAMQAVREYVNSKEYSVHDTLSVFKVFEYPEEAKRLIYGE